MATPAPDRAELSAQTMIVTQPAATSSPRTGKASAMHDRPVNTCPAGSLTDW